MEKDLLPTERAIIRSEISKIIAWGNMVQASAANESQNELFVSLAEQIKLPFVQITHAAELIAKDGGKSDNQQTILEVSKATLQLIDGFLLSVRLQSKSQLELEPVSISSVLYDSAQVLHKYAKINGCEVEIEVNGKYEPVMANREAIKYALTNLGYSFISAAAADKNKRIKLAVRRGREGIAAGVYGDSVELSNALLKQARKLVGTAHQPFAQLTSENAAGVFVADNLFEVVGSEMKVSRLGGMSGLAATFLPSKQLSLV